MHQRSFTVDGPGTLIGRTIAYTEWGAETNPRVLVCAHGLTRVGRDFDVLAGALCSDYRVICPDAAGRGASGWLPGAADYSYAQYLADTAALLAEIGATEVDWLGTSMGGFLGLMLAASKSSPIRRMVMNDIGPFLPQASLLRISGYLSKDQTFADVGELESYLRKIHAPFGALTDSQWRHMAAHSTRPAGEAAGGGIKLHYDPAIAEAFSLATGADIDVWGLWDKIRCPVLVVRGQDSDLLPRETARQMTERGPKAALVEISGCGHAPALMADDQITAVRDWLLDG